MSKKSQFRPWPEGHSARASKGEQQEREEMKSRRSEIIAQKRAWKAIARVRPKVSSHPYLCFASPPLLLNHLLFEGEICFIRGKQNKTLLIWVICSEVCPRQEESKLIIIC